MLPQRHRVAATGVLAAVLAVVRAIVISLPQRLHLACREKYSQLLLPLLQRPALSVTVSEVDSAARDCLHHRLGLVLVLCVGAACRVQPMLLLPLLLRRPSSPHHRAARQSLTCLLAAPLGHLSCCTPPVLASVLPQLQARMLRQVWPTARPL